MGLAQPLGQCCGDKWPVPEARGGPMATCPVPALPKAWQKPHGDKDRGTATQHHRTPKQHRSIHPLHSHLRDILTKTQLSQMSSFFRILQGKTLFLSRSRPKASLGLSHQTASYTKDYRRNPSLLSYTFLFSNRYNTKINTN